MLLVETIYHAGLRRSEAANMTVADLHLSGDSPTLLVRQGKGGKDRLVNLNPYIRKRLLDFTQNMKPGDSVFGLAPKSISGQIANWSAKAGVPQLPPHSLRHKFATDILNRGGSIRDVQQLMGYESLATTEAYLAVTVDGLAKTVGLLDNSKRAKTDNKAETAVSQRLEKVNESLNDIKKKMEAAEAGAETSEKDSFKETVHKSKIRELARALTEKISLSSLWNEDLWRDLPVDYKPGQYPLSVGTLEIDKAGRVRVHHNDPAEGICPITVEVDHFTTFAVMGYGTTKTPAPANSWWLWTIIGVVATLVILGISIGLRRRGTL